MPASRLAAELGHFSNIKRAKVQFPDRILLKVTDDGMSRTCSRLHGVGNGVCTLDSQPLRPPKKDFCGLLRVPFFGRVTSPLLQQVPRRRKSRPPEIPVEFA